MLGAFRNAMRIPDLRRKILYTAALLLVFRFGAFVPVPGIDAQALSAALLVDEGSVFGLLDLFAGGALGRFTIFAMGVGPYITASIILQLLAVVIPRLEELQKEGIEGRKKIQQYTRYGTVLLGLVQGLATVMLARSVPGAMVDDSFFIVTVIVVSLTAGSVFLVWLGEKITEHGIGNGVSLIIFTGIVAELPTGLYQAVRAVGQGGVSALSLILWLVLAVFIVAGVVMVQEGQRRIPIQYARRVVGRRMMGGGTTHLPLKVNQAGVIPVIFASSLLVFPLTLGQFIPALSVINRWIGYGTTGYFILYTVLIIFFTFFYTAVTFNPAEVANNLKKNGGFIPGLRPGRPTAEYLDKVLTRITLAGGVFLALVALSPYLLAAVTRMPTQFLYFGGTGLLIVVGVALDTMRQIEAQLLLRHYEGFLR